MRRAAVLTCGRALLLVAAIQLTAELCLYFDANRATAAMAMLLEVLAVAATGDWIVSMAGSLATVAAMSSTYFQTRAGLGFLTLEGCITFSAILVTTLTGSRLAVQARRRANAAEHRRTETELLQRFGQSLLARNTGEDAGKSAVTLIVELFGVIGAVLRGGDEGQSFDAGQCGPGEPDQALDLELSPDNSVLEIYGGHLSAEVVSSVGQWIGVARGRAASLREMTRLEGERRGEELRSIVLNGLAQRFRTPLTAIKAAASALRGAAYLPDGPGKELVHIIDEEADRLALQISEALHFARIESHRVNPRRELCSSAQLITNVVSRVSGCFRGRELVVDVSEKLPPIVGDRFLLEQMLFEVIDNAWKYSKPGSGIGIGGFEEEGKVVLTVTSEGDEIAGNEAELIFAKFYRGAVHRSSRERTGIEGTGVGLAVARAIAEAHDGSIRLDSRAGAHTFRFSLPTGNNEGQFFD